MEYTKLLQTISMLYILISTCTTQIKLDRSFNFEDYQFKPITALQCSTGASKIYSSKRDVCNNEKEEVKHDTEKSCYNSEDKALQN